MAGSSRGGDLSTRGFVDEMPDPLRYSASTRTEWEATGMICSRIPSGSRVLDVGCGTGSISSLVIAECAATLVGIEPDPERAAVCQARGMDVVCGYFDDATATALGEFDVIMFADVLEHVPDPTSLLERAARHLTPRGRVLVSVPNIGHWTVRARLLAGNFDYQPMGIMDATHLRWFTSRTIESVIRAAGLQVVEHDFTSGAWMSEYRRIPESVRSGLLRRAVRTVPGLFGCQHIVTAQRAS